MTTEITTGTRVLCPSCGNKANRVSLVTLRALLREEFASQLGTDDQPDCESNGDGCDPITADTGWRFCDSQDCDVVYFSEQGDSTFTKSQLTAAVGVKETSGVRPLCYCFNHSIATIKEELQTRGHSDALADIRAKMNDPGCRCETENPSGACCLGSVSKGITVAQQELGMIDRVEVPSNPASNRGERIAKIGALVSAVVASSCCWLPLLLVAVGVSGVGVASTLEAYRPLFIVVTVGFLGAAFYLTYRPRQAAGGGNNDCRGTEATDDCCAPAANGRFGMMTLNKAMLWVVTALAIASLLFPSYVGALVGGGDGKTFTDNMNRASITVEGMTCEGCASIVGEAIHTVPGVLAVAVDYKNSRAVVGMEICCPVPKDKILTALDRAGYRGTFVESNTLPGSSADATNGRTN